MSRRRLTVPDFQLNTTYLSLPHQLAVRTRDEVRKGGTWDLTQTHGPRETHGQACLPHRQSLPRRPLNSSGSQLQLQGQFQNLYPKQSFHHSPQSNMSYKVTYYLSLSDGFSPCLGNYLLICYLCLILLRSFIYHLLLLVLNSKFKYSQVISGYTIKKR